MPVWLWIVDAVAVTLVALLVTAIVLAVRRRLISRGGPTFDLGISARSGVDAGGWILGVGRYRGEELEFFRIFSVSPWPKHRFTRGTVEVSGRREATRGEAQSTHLDFVVIEVETQTPVVQMALTPAALTGLLAWLESSPPGRGVNNVL